MLIDTSIKLDYRNVLLRPKRSNITENVDSRSEVESTRNYRTINSGQRFNCTPIIASNMSTIGTFAMAHVLSDYKCMTALHKFYKNVDIKKYLDDNKNISEFIFHTFGANTKAKEALKRTRDLYSSDNDIKICLDVANGYLQSFVAFVEETRRMFPKAVIMAGNIATREMAEQLILSGADIVKVGIGPGSACLTRKMTGVGYPQLSAVMECAEAAHGLGGLVCADGGCEEPGDIIKALGGGADFVMIGGLLAGYSECGSIDKDGMVEFYGMSSEHAMETHNLDYSEYRASEGRAMKLKCRGSVREYIQHDILGGLRSGMTLIGAKRIKDIPKRAEFVLTRKALNTMYDKEIVL